MTNNQYTLTHHPDWFALYGGKRHTQPGQRNHQLCYSNEDLLREAVQFARAQFDHYKMDVVSIMPPIPRSISWASRIPASPAYSREVIWR